MAEKIKTYTSDSSIPNEVAPALELEVKQMGELYDKFGGAPDDPHRHDYYTIIWPIHAKGKHVVDFEEYELEPNAIFFISPGQVHQLVTYNRPEGYAITFSKDFLLKNSIPESFIADLHLFSSYGKTPPLSLNINLIVNLKQIVDQMIFFKGSDMNFKNDSLGALLKLFLIYCHSNCDAANINSTHAEVSGTNNIREFKVLLDKYYKLEHSVNFYADQLNISADHLNRVVKSYTGKTAKEFIDDKIILEAKRLVLFSDMNSKEIGYELSFAKPSNFSNFFKKHTGLTTSDFKSKKFI